MDKVSRSKLVFGVRMAEKEARMDLPILGIDIAKRKFDVALMVGGKIKNKVCQNTPEGFKELLRWLERQGVRQTHACMEATGNYGEALAVALGDAGHLVSIVNPARIQGFAKSELLRTKTDQVDAGLIARFCAAMKPDAWTPPPVEVRHLQALVRRLDVLNALKMEEENRLESTPADSPTVSSIQAHLHFLRKEIAATEALIRDHFDQYSGLRAQRDLLTSIPGIGDKTAAVILAEIRCVGDYESARQLVAYAGLAPRERLSGSSVRGKARLCKTGNGRLRRALYMPAVVAKRYNPTIQAFCHRLLERGKAPKAVIGAAMRKLLHIVYGVLKSGRPFDPGLAIN